MYAPFLVLSHKTLSQNNGLFIFSVIAQSLYKRVSTFTRDRRFWFDFDMTLNTIEITNFRGSRKKNIVNLRGLNHKLYK